MSTLTSPAISTDAIVAASRASADPVACLRDACRRAREAAHGDNRQLQAALVVLGPAARALGIEAQVDVFAALFGPFSARLPAEVQAERESLRRAAHAESLRAARRAARKGLRALRRLAIRGHAQPGQRGQLERAASDALQTWLRLRHPDRYITHDDCSRLDSIVRQAVAEAARPEQAAIRGRLQRGRRKALRREGRSE